MTRELADVSPWGEQVMLPTDQSATPMTILKVLPDVCGRDAESTGESMRTERRCESNDTVTRGRFHHVYESQSWRSGNLEPEADHISRKIIKVHTKDADYKGSTGHADDDPQ